MKKLLALAAITVLVAACASAPANKHTKADAESAIAAAEHEASRADKMGFQWRDIEKTIKSAKDAVAEEKFDEAVKLSNNAKKQAQLGIDQAQSQKDAAPRYNN